MKGVKRIILAIMFCLIVFVCGLATTMPVFAAESTTGTAIVTGDKLNVRSGPGKEYDSIGKVYKDNSVNVIGVEDEWLKIEYQNSVGYISGEFADFTPDEVESVEDEESDESTEGNEYDGEIPEVGEMNNSSGGGYKVIFGLIGAIIVIVIIILITIKSIKDSDDADYEDDEYDDDYEDDDEPEDEDYEEDDEDYEEDDDYEEDEEDDEEYEYVMVKRPKQKPVSSARTTTTGRSSAAKPATSSKTAKRLDDYTLDIDPSFFDD